MRLRTKPCVLRFHKPKFEKEPDRYWLHLSMLYMPYENEDQLSTRLSLAKMASDETFNEYIAKIDHVQSQVMEFIEDNAAAMVLAAEAVIAQEVADLVGDMMDPEGQQEHDDNEMDEIQPDDQFDHLNPDNLENSPQNLFAMEFRPIEVRPLLEIRKDVRRLDYYQRTVVEIAIRHARCFVKARCGVNPIPNPPLVMVDGAAGSGKSATINVMKEIVQLILQQPGDNPECPRILLCAPTGTAAVNIQGQTLHSAFGFTFGDQHYSLSDKNRDTKRSIFKNLRFLIIDEVSMVKADQLYQLDLRLRELMMKPDKDFGGVSIFLFGDIMQLKPVQGKPIWTKPRSAEYHQMFDFDGHWQKFQSISLVENHRQEGDKFYANLLNRVRVGEQTEDDLTCLMNRIRPVGHSDMKGATVIACTHKVVNQFNQAALNELPGQTMQLEAVNSHQNMPDFEPKIDPKKGTVEQTSYVQNLILKKNCRVMLIANLDVKDLLCNGSMGTLKGVIRDAQGIVTTLMVQFDLSDSGREMRRQHPQLSKSWQRCTPIFRQVHKYSPGKSRKAVQTNVATVYQFPIIHCAATTTHKMQGQTLKVPQAVAVDISTVFGANQAYVMLGRMQSVDQLFIIDKLPENKIYCDVGALNELMDLKHRSLNQNPSVWEKTVANSVKIYTHNICSLRDKFDDVTSDPMIKHTDVAIFVETHLLPNSSCHDIQLEGFELDTNSFGRGKGLALYFKPGIFKIKHRHAEETLQITKMCSNSVTIIAVYRSQNNKNLDDLLKNLVDKEENTTIIAGDMNLCAKKQANHKVFTTLKNLGFR